MPWLETAPMEERGRFIDDHRLGLYDMTELCVRYAVSRKTGYKWLARYDAVPPCRTGVGPPTTVRTRFRGRWRSCC